MEFMKVCSAGEQRWVLSEADGLHWLDGNPFGEWTRAAEVSTLAGIRFLPPCAPTKVVAVGVNYLSHAEEMGTQLLDRTHLVSGLIRPLCSARPMNSSGGSMPCSV